MTSGVATSFMIKKTVTKGIVIQSTSKYTGSRLLQDLLEWAPDYNEPIYLYTTLTAILKIIDFNESPVFFVKAERREEYHKFRYSQVLLFMNENKYEWTSRKDWSMLKT